MRVLDFKYIHEIGNKKKQEDSIWPDPSDVSTSTTCFIICDGVGGSENGEIASKYIAEYTGQILSQANKREISLDLVNSVLQKARAGLIEKADSLLLNHDMATTFVMVKFVDRRAFISWCGDSRIYHIRKGQILYRSSDHSLVNLLINRGEITEEEARRHPQKNVITKAIRVESPEINADSAWIDHIADGDYFLLCSDGLLEMLTDGNINEIFSRNDENPEKILEIVKEKCKDNTRDNYSMFLIKVGNTDNTSKNILRRSMFFIVPIFIVALAALYIFLKPKAEATKSTSPTTPRQALDTSSLHVSGLVDGKEDTSILSYELIKLDDGTIDTLWVPKKSTKDIKVK
jgi:protein phosphatase